MLMLRCPEPLCPQTKMAPRIVFGENYKKCQILEFLSSGTGSTSTRFKPLCSTALYYHTTLGRTGMASESSFTDFGDPFIDADVAGLFAVSIPSISLSTSALRIQGLDGDLDLLAFESEGFSQDIFGLPLSFQVPSFPTPESLPVASLGRPLETPPTPGVTQDGIHSPEISHEVLNFQPQAVTTPPHIVVRIRAFSSSNSRY